MTIRELMSGLAAIAFVATMSAPAQAYEAGPVTGGGTIEGTIVYRGDVPTTKIIPTKDIEVCGAPREEPLIEVGGDQAVLNAVVYLVDVAKGKAWPEPGKPPELNNLKCRFEPAVQMIPAGSLEVVNSDPVLHNTHGYYGKRTAFNLALPNKDQRIPVELKRAGDCPHRLRRAWLDGRLGLCGGQSLLRDHRRRRQVQHHRCSARRLQARGDPPLHRAHRAARNGRRRIRPPV